ncbi:MAG: lipopolysaccharide heptosyltransferase II, partial [Candidatus Omnitrophica bacterium]|nr:lipopolysaccharide heptosyltransferase II [Candidatus Omnitrophota bacterium]
MAPNIKQLKILIFAPNWVGDTIMSMPLVRSIRAQFPDSKIILIARPHLASLWQEEAFSDGVWLFDIFNKRTPLSGYIDLALKIKKIKFDLAIILPHSFRWALLVYLLKIPKRVGYAVKGRGFLLTKSLKYKFSDITKKHMIDGYLELVRLCNIEPSYKEVFLRLSDEISERSLKILYQYGIGSSESIIAIAPGALYGPAKRWPLEYFASLADTLAKELNVKIAILGSSNEQELAMEIKELMQEKAINLTGQTDLITTAGIIKRSLLLISNDSGLMHLGVAVNTKTIGIFGSTSSRWTGPYGKAISKQRVVCSSLACSPCFKKTCPFR